MNSAPYPWQEESWQALTQRLAEGRFGHAVLLCGPAGTGKRALAEALAQRLLCEKSLACGACPACLWYAAGNHPDWHVLEPEEDKSTISVDGVRALCSQLDLSSMAGGRKVALIDPADSMTTAAANSLLKTLEEPAGDTAIILVASRPSRLPATVLSRCQVQTVPAPPVEAATQWLEGESGPGEWGGLLHLCGGGPLAAQILDEAGFGEELTALARDVAGLLAGKADAASVAGRWTRLDTARCLDWLAQFVSDAIRWRFGLTEGDTAHRFVSKGLPAALKNITLNRLFEYLDAVRVAQRRLEGPVTDGLIVETLLIPLATGLSDANFETELS